MKQQKPKQISLQRHFLLLALLLSFVQSTEAQTIISKQHHGMRPGDCLVKQQVEYIDPGNEGEQVMWNFSKQQPVNKNYRLNYYGITDSLLIGEEHSALYKFLTGGDSLLLAGVENRTTKIENRKPELLLIYPTAYGNRYEDYFHGNGDYGNHLFITARGKTTTKADAWGTLLLPEGDTLRNVLRVRHLKTISERMVPYPFAEPGDTLFCSDSINFRLAADTLLMQVETYRWYADGWRYPVFETVSNRIILHGEPQEYSRSSFYYQPVDQYYDLDSDPDNQAVRDEAEEQLRAAREKQQQDNNPANGQSSSGNPVDFHASVSPDGNTVSLEYTLDGDTDISIQLFDMQGRQLTHEHKGIQGGGVQRQTLSLSGFQPGEYTLRLVANGKVYGLKILK